MIVSQVSQWWEANAKTDVTMSSLILENTTSQLREKIENSRKVVSEHVYK